MNKQELTIVVLLFAALIGWSVFFKPAPKPKPDSVAAGGTNVVENVDLSEAQVASPSRDVPDQPAAALPVVTNRVADNVVAADEPRAEERLVLLENDRAVVAISSWGGAVKSVELKEYPTSLDDPTPLLLDFASDPAMAFSDMPGFSEGADFTVEEQVGSRSAEFTRVAGTIQLRRRIELGDGYQLHVEDSFTNTGSEPVGLAAYGLALGPMSPVATKGKVRGVAYLGADTLAAHGGEGVKYWGKKLPKLFGVGGPFSCSRTKTELIPPELDHTIAAPVSWAAVKNKFFVQIMAPEGGGASCVVHAERDMEARGLRINRLSATVRAAEKVLQPGETLTRTASYYAGPKKRDILKGLGLHQEEVMQFGWMKWLCKHLLTFLNKIDQLVGNYGVAIIILTVIVRLIFWPITHKSTESMKKMQELQPQVKVLREKYKANPQKMNQEVMLLYRENKANPMSGCLPIVVQIPVFIALFTVLRSAVELRFAPFLWIADLSEPEGLFAGSVPWIGSLNILPLFMAATMALQQHLTPTGGDPQQKKMMMFMPVVMLFIFYSMPSALVLYWSTSQSLSIAQLLLQRRKKAAEKASGDASRPTPPPAKPAAKPGSGKKRKK